MDKRESEAREVLARHMASKHWASLVREGKDDNWGVIKPREAIAAMLAFADIRPAADLKTVKEACAKVADAEIRDTHSDDYDAICSAVGERISERIRSLDLSALSCAGEG